ncbi:hypothetical protein ABPG72_020653 [Tetrahymena utriculariae]
MLNLLKTFQLKTLRRTLSINGCNSTFFSRSLLPNNYALRSLNNITNFKFSETPQKEGEEKIKQEIQVEEIKLNRFKDAKEIKDDYQKDEDCSDQEMTPLFKLALLSIGASALFIVYKLNEMQSQLKKIDEVKVSHRGQAKIGDEWELIDTSGNPITPQSLLGKYYLVYFGFCHCPDICPANLIKIRNALNQIKKMPEGQDLDIKVLFISIDPERDTPQIIRDYLDTYDTSFLGATGSPTNESKLKQALKSFKVVANKINYDPDDEELKTLLQKYNGDLSKIYTMDHTTNTFLMGTKGEFIGFFDGNRSEDQLASLVLKSVVDNKRTLSTAQNQSSVK